MPQYILRDLPPDLWDRFKIRAMSDGWHLRTLFLQLLEDYAAGRITLTRHPEPRPDVGTFQLKCPNGHDSGSAFTKDTARAWLTSGSTTLPCLTCGAAVPVAQDDRDTIESWTHTPSPGRP